MVVAPRDYIRRSSRTSSRHGTKTPINEVPVEMRAARTTQMLEEYNAKSAVVIRNSYTRLALMI